MARYATPLPVPDLVFLHWVDKDTDLARSAAFSHSKTAVVEADWLNRQGHREVRILPKSTAGDV